MLLKRVNLLFGNLLGSGLLDSLLGHRLLSGSGLLDSLLGSGLGWLLSSLSSWLLGGLNSRLLDSGLGCLLGGGLLGSCLGLLGGDLRLGLLLGNLERARGTSSLDLVEGAGGNTLLQGELEPGGSLLLISD